MAKTQTRKDAINGIYIAFSVSYPPTLVDNNPPTIIPAAGLVTTTIVKEYKRLFSSSIKSPNS